MRCRRKTIYLERYVCVMRAGHPAAADTLTLERYAGQDHVLVLPRGLTAQSAIDVFLASKGLSRRVARTVPSFHLAIPIVLQSDLITSMPERNARLLLGDQVVIKDMPIDAPPLPMKLIRHPAHHGDARADFIAEMLTDALALSERD